MSSPSPKLFKTLGLFSSVLGASLLAISLWGQWMMSIRVDEAEKRAGERFDPALVTQIPTYRALVDTAEARLLGKSKDAEKMQVVCDLITDRFSHDEALHTPFSNWLLYGAGFIHPTFRHIWAPKTLVSKGHCLLCDQASYLLLDLARSHGFKARHIGLQGHVVTEVWYDDDWHLYDPDLEVIPVGETGEVLSLDELAKDEVLLQKYYGPFPGMANLVRARQNHLYMSTPDGARFEWKANILAIIEKLAEILKYVIPVGLILGGLWLLRRPARA